MNFGISRRENCRGCSIFGVLQLYHWRRADMKMVWSYCALEIPFYDWSIQYSPQLFADAACLCRALLELQAIFHLISFSTCKVNDLGLKGGFSTRLWGLNLNAFLLACKVFWTLKACLTDNVYMSTALLASINKVLDWMRFYSLLLLRSYLHGLKAFKAFSLLY